jgi:hypothetical protein
MGVVSSHRWCVPLEGEEEELEEAEDEDESK